ncbi:MAG: type II/IV secretion system protein [Planctomycetota bacterium]|nr:MAG: type II/IV secretion system protein [Planctomycetota bacterium]
MLDAGEFVIRDLLDRGRVSEEDLAGARRHGAEHGLGLVDALIATGVVDSREVAITRAAICESPFVDLEAYDVDLSLAERLPRTVAERHAAFPLFSIEGVTTIAMADPLDLRAVDAVRQAIRGETAMVLADAEPLRALIARAYRMAGASRDRGAATARDPGDLTTGEEPIVAAVNDLIARAIEEGASDVHLNPDEHELHVRHRIDGVLQSRQGPGAAAHAGLVQRIKVMANLDLTQTRRPQDGKFRFDHETGPVDVRVSVIPTVCGENVVMRLLRRGASLKDFNELGMPPGLVQRFEDLLALPHGMALVTGPTGSGKTTTLYTALARLNTPDRNIMTIEDPVEIRLPMVRQTQVNPEVGLTFAGALRSILRQDPDVVLVGEIRDQETAQIAVQAALTGHLVLSTLHTNDAVGAVARLRDFGLPPFALNSALLGVVAQRLVRRVCPDCAVPDEPTEATLRAFGLTRQDAALLRRGEGCPRCLGAGYRGRVGVYELFRLTPAVQSAIEAGAPALELARAARADGMRPMLDDGLEKARLGLTTLEELWRVRTEFGADESPAAHATEPPLERRLSA